VARAGLNIASYMMVLVLSGFAEQVAEDKLLDVEAGSRHPGSRLGAQRMLAEAATSVLSANTGDINYCSSK
jgi:hypothetical protein